MKLLKEELAQIILLFSCAALIAAWAAQYVFGFEACILCYYQRYLYIAAIFILAFSLYFIHGRFSFFLVATGLVLLSCAGVAAYQVAVENQWVELPKICAPPVPTGSFEDFKAALTTRAYVPCDKVEWSLLGISMAGYNFILSLFLAILSFSGVFLNGRPAKKSTRR